MPNQLHADGAKAEGANLSPIAESDDHRALITYAGQIGIDPCAVRNLLWRIRAPRSLPHFPDVCSRIARMLEVAARVWQVRLSDWHIEEWPAITDFVLRERQNLASLMGEEFDPKPAKGEDKIPFYGYLTNWAPYPSFGLKRESNDDRYLLAQAHLLFAYARDTREHTTLEQYERCTEPYFPRPHRDPQLASYAIRQLSREGELLDGVLEAFPLHLPPARFARALRAVRVPDRRLAIRLRDDLRNYLQLAHGQRKPRQGRGGGAGGGAVVAGTASYCAETWELAHVEPDEDDPHAPDVEYTVTAHSTLSAAERQECAQSGDCPAEYGTEAEVETTLPGEAAQRDPSSYRGLISTATNHTEMAAQMLWYSYGVPVTHEIAELVRGAYRILRSPPSRGNDRDLLRLEIAALALTMLATGATLAKAHSLYVCHPNGANHDVPLAFILRGEETNSWWRMRAPVPDGPADETTAQTNPEFNVFVQQPDVTHAELLLRRVLKARDLLGKVCEGVQPFTRAEETYRTALRKWLIEIDPSKRLTIAKVPNFVFVHLVRTATGDVGDACYASAHWHGLANVPRHYMMPSLARLQDLYRQTVQGTKAAVCRALLPARRIEESRRPLISTTTSNSERIGNRIYPTRTAVTNLVTSLKAEIRREMRSGTAKASVEGHNAYTLYTIQYVTAAVGYRWPSSYMLSLDDIDVVTGFCVLRDKTVRSSLILPEPLKQVRFYQDYLASYAPVRLPVFNGRRATCYFLAESLDPVEVTPSSCAAVFRGRFPYPKNAFRYFAKTELREAKCPSEIIEAWLGHNPEGRQTYHRFSNFGFGAYRQALTTYLAPLLREVRFSPVAWEAGDGE